MESVISLHPMVAAMSPASVAPDQSEAADTARKIARVILLTNELCDFSEWTPEKVKERQFRLAELAAEAWSFDIK